MLKRFRPGKFWFAVATLVGSTIGVGFYGIPFTFQKAGVSWGILFLLVVSGLVLLTNLLYGEVVLRTYGRHQFVGYINRYLGPWAKRINLFIFWVSIYGALIGIIIINGDFLANLLAPIVTLSPLVLSGIFLILATGLVLAGLKTVAHLDFIMMIFLGAVIVLLAVVGWPDLRLGNYPLAINDFWFLPFGVILFSLNSMPGVSLMRELLVGTERQLKKAITYGTLLPAGLYLIFTVLVLGISGEVTSPDAISGLQGFLGQPIVFVGSFMGFLTSSTIFINLAVALRESLEEDFRVKRPGMWILALVPPYLLFLSGIRNFIDIIGLVGGLAVSLQSILLLLLYVKAKHNGERIPEYSIRLPIWVIYLLMLVFCLAAVYTVMVK